MDSREVSSQLEIPSWSRNVDKEFERMPSEQVLTAFESLGYVDDGDNHMDFPLEKKFKNKNGEVSVCLQQWNEGQQASYSDSLKLFINVEVGKVDEELEQQVRSELGAAEENLKELGAKNFDFELPERKADEEHDFGSRSEQAA